MGNETPQPRADDDAERLKHAMEQAHAIAVIVVANWRANHPGRGPLHEDLFSMIEQAALNAITRLLDSRDAALREAREEAEGWRGLVARYESDGLQEEVERLREALTPFAMLGGSPDMQAYHDLEDDVVLYKNSGYGIAAGDVRNARHVLGPTSEMHFRRSQPGTPSPVNPHHNLHEAIYGPSDAATDGGRPEAEVVERHARAYDPLGWEWYDRAPDDHPAKPIFRNRAFAQSRAAIATLPVAADSAAKASAEDVERAKWLWDNLPLRKHENKQSWLDMTVAALSEARAEGERAGIERAAQLCEQEGNARNHRADNPLPGDESLSPFPQSMVQLSKAVTAHFLARDIRALLPPAAPERK